jgi:RNA polymerase sigma-70 factor (ECF subfamily)
MKAARWLGRMVESRSAAGVGVHPGWRASDSPRDQRAAPSSTTSLSRKPSWLAHLSGTGPDQSAALSDLRDALFRGLRRALSHRVRVDDEFLEDVVQDALVRIRERLPQFEGRSRFLTWAMSIAILVAMSELRRRRWKDVSLDEVVASGGLTPGRAIVDEPSPDAQPDREAILAAMQELIRNGLTTKQREALLAELRGMPQDEIARHLGSNRNAIFKLTHDARKRLKRGLEAAGFTAEDIGTAFAG